MSAAEERRPTSRPECPKCTTHRVRIVGQSGRPPIVFFRCDACEYVFSRPLDDKPPPELAG
jgi:hypothetical protein